MAKQRPQPRRRKPPVTTIRRPAPSPRSDLNSSASPAAGPVREARPQASSGGPAKRATYAEAVAVYERGLEALQRHDYRQAEALLLSVLERFPEEKELHERVRLYLNVCQQRATPREAAPETVEERLYAATLALNGGRYEEAISHLRLVRDEDADNDYALYMLAVAHAQRGEHAEAVAHLERAIAINHDNRGLARRDPDLEMLRDDEAFRATLDAESHKPTEPRRPTRPKSGR